MFQAGEGGRGAGCSGCSYQRILRVGHLPVSSRERASALNSVLVDFAASGEGLSVLFPFSTSYLLCSAG